MANIAIAAGGVLLLTLFFGITMLVWIEVVESLSRW